MSIKRTAALASLALSALLSPAAARAQDGGFVTHVGAKPQGSGFVRPSNPWRTTTAPASVPNNSGGYIRSISDDGAIIQLDDSSVWLVEDVDRINSELWLATDDVVVNDDYNGRCLYPTASIIVNIDDAESVCARRIR